MIKSPYWTIFTTIIIIGFLAPIGVSYYNSYRSDIQEKQNLAQAYEIDILGRSSLIYGTVDGPKSEFTDLGNNTYKIRVQCSNIRIYPDWGLFHKHSLEISKFDPKLSQSLYEYYFNILWAEQNRQLICDTHQKIMDLQRKNELDSNTFQQYRSEIIQYENNMRGGAVFCEMIEQPLLKNLDEVINSKPFPDNLFPNFNMTNLTKN